MKNNSKKKIELKFSKLSCLFFFLNVFISFAQGCPDIPISNSDSNETQRFSIYGENEADDLGESVADAGDINGDGISDIIIGAPGIDDGTIENVGNAFIIFGATGISTSSININSLDGTNGFTVKGINTSDKIGIAVDTAGDINNDGIDDVLIGSNGKAIIIFGSSTGFSSLYTTTDINNSNGIILSHSNSYFGQTLSNIPDINNDGIDDVVIGEPTNNIGNAYVFYGSPSITSTNTSSLNGSNGFKIEGFSQTSSGYGLNVSNAGDINNDGIQDIVIGYPRYNEGTENDTGRTAILFGNSTGFSSILNLNTLNGTNGFIITDVGDYTRLGTVVTDAKDFNNDGIDDFAITTDNSAYVIYGKITPFSSLIKISDITTTDKFVFNAGWYQSPYRISSIDGLSDINNDGITDLIVSSPHSYGYARSGSVYIIYGGTSVPNTLESLEINGTNGYHIFDDIRYSYKGFGHSVSNTGDFNNDGTNDFIVGSRINNSDIYRKKGAAHVFFGNTINVIDTEVPTINCPSKAQELYANSILPNYINQLSSANDNCSYNTEMTYTQTPAEGTLFTSDTTIKITVTDRSGNTNSCSFMVTLKTTTSEIDCTTTDFSTTNLNGTNGLVIYGEDANSYSGYDVNTAGDVNGDGIDDFIILAKGDTVNHTGPYRGYHIDVTGGVYIIFGTSSGFPPNIDLGYLNGVNGFKVNSDNLPHSRTSSDNNFFKADTAGDINRDGIDDIILSNPYRANRTGHVYILFGKNTGFSSDFDLATLNGSNGFTIVGTGRNGFLGIDLDNLGDVNGDNIDDVILTNSTSTSYTESGKSFIIYGSTSSFPSLFNISDLNGSNGFTITSNGSTTGNLGHNVAGIGDVNGDNINDIAVGGNKDRKFIIFGKSNSTTFPSVLNVENLNGTNGFAVEHSLLPLNSSVNNANDVNNDGYNDIVFGNQHVLFGNDTFPAVFDLNDLDGTNGFSTSNAGKVFSFAGDFNNDNYDDLIYADYRSQYIIYGKKNWEESISTNSSAPGCLLKISLLNNNDLVSGSYAGDVNNDGIDDLVLGHNSPYSSSYLVNADSGFSYVIFGKDMPDTEIPVITCPTNQILASGSLLPDYTSLATVTDNCDSCIVVTQLPAPESTYTSGMIITLTATDKKGNSVSCNFTVADSVDTVPPTATNPLAINIQCSDNIPLPNPLVVTDEADDNTTTPIVAFISDVNDGMSNPETIIRTYSITDDTGNSINVTQTITVNDTTNPTATNPAPINVSCTADVPTPNINAVTDEDDNCTTNPTVTFVSDVNTSPGIITRTYSVADDAGNSINVTQTITVNDTTNPTATNPAPINVSCTADVPTPNINLVTDEADNCTTNPTVTFVSDVNDGMISPETITRTYSITDDAGNSINVTQTITVNDTTNPTASNPTPINVSCTADVPTPNINLVTDEADNCTTNPTVSFVSDVSDGMINPETITRTYSITDDAGNSTNVTQTITVNDTTKPTASNPIAINVSCAGDIPTADITVINDETDNCTTNPTVTFVSDVSNGMTNPETITRTYSITDDAGNSTNVTQTITVNDTTKPTASNPTAINISCAGDIPTADITVVTDEADNCTTNPTVTFVSDVNTSPGIITRTYSVVDDAGNSINVTQTITVNDTTNPTATNPAPINVSCAADVPTPNVNVVTDEADNCTTNPTVTFVSDVNDGMSNPETIIRTYSITDDTGNSINVTQTITVNDTTNPTATNPAPINVSCTAGVPTPNINVVTDEADNCTTNPTVTFVSDVNDGMSNPETIIRTYSITDDTGNSINVTQTITVNDTTNPTATNPAPINVSCTADVPTPNINLVTDEADNCTTNPTVTFVSDVNTSPGIITRTYNITDDAGNSTNVTQTITINDTTKPTASNPIAINVSCAGDIPTADITVVTDEADNCTTNPTVTFVSDVSNGMTNPETITRTYSITDDAGNSTNVTQTINISDIVKPTASNPLPINVSCIGDIPAADINVVTDEADNCTTNPTVTFISDASDGMTNPETITRTYRITDNAGNFVDITQSIIVNDTIAPQIVCPSDIIKKIPIGTTSTVVDYTIQLGTDNCNNPSTALIGGLPSGSEFPVGTSTIQIEVTDKAGNTANCSFNIIVAIEDIITCDIKAGEDIEIIEGENTQLDALTPNTGTIQWFPSEGLSDITIPNPIANPTETTTYTLRYTNDNGCFKEDTITIFVNSLKTDKTKYGFSPDGDGINEYWEIDGIDRYPNNNVFIYNRWGDLVFEATNYNNSTTVFRGIANKKTGLGAKKLPEGTYFFYIEIEGNHHLKKEKGFLVLKR